MRKGFPAVALVLLGTGVAMAQSPYESAADFAKYARKLREQALLKVEPQVFVPTASRTSTATRYPWKTNIVTTVFWVGEQAGGNNPVPNYKSCWDANWTSNYGGFDTPEPPRAGITFQLLHPPAESFLLRAPLQRRHAWAVQAGSAAGDSVV